MKQLYKTYITRHPVALARLTALTTPGPATNPAPAPIPPFSGKGKEKESDVKKDKDGKEKLWGMTPEVKAYLATTRELTASHTHAWDLPSLLIKVSLPLHLPAKTTPTFIINSQPVQRLLKYPLLLQSILAPTLASTPNHPDIPNLLSAKAAMEDVARDVNEARRRWEVVKGVLEGYGFGVVPGSTTRPTIPHPPASGSGGGSKFSMRRPKSSGVGASPNGKGGPMAGGVSGVVGPEDLAQHPLSRIQSLKTRLKTSLSV